MKVTASLFFVSMVALSQGALHCRESLKDTKLCFTTITALGDSWHTLALNAVKSSTHGGENTHDGQEANGIRKGKPTTKKDWENAIFSCVKAKDHEWKLAYDGVCEHGCRESESSGDECRHWGKIFV